MNFLITLLTLAVAVVASPINATLAERIPHRSTGVPPRRGGLIDHCDLIVTISHGEEYGHVHATCNVNPSVPGNEYYSSLDLNLCMGNYNNHLDWGYLGGAMASCTNCASRRFDTRYIDCDCGSLDLNDGIYMAINGALACYDQVSVPHRVGYIA